MKCNSSYGDQIFFFFFLWSFVVVSSSCWCWMTFRKIFRRWHKSQIWIDVLCAVLLLKAPSDMFFCSDLAKWDGISDVSAAKITTVCVALSLSTRLKHFNHKPWRYIRTSVIDHIACFHLQPTSDPSTYPNPLQSACKRKECTVRQCQSAGVREVWHRLSSSSTPCYKSLLQVGVSRHGDA